MQAEFLRTSNPIAAKESRHSGELKKQIHKSKYQKPNIEELIGTAEQKINKKKQSDMFFDHGSHVCIRPTTPQRRHKCTVWFFASGGNSTGAYCFQTGFLWAYDNPDLVPTTNGLHRLRTPAGVLRRHFGSHQKHGSRSRRNGCESFENMDRGKMSLKV